MPIECSPNELQSASKCFCLSEKQSQAAMLYLLNQISGLNLTPAELASRSACFCMGEKATKAAEAYLMCQIASAAGA